MTWNRSYSLTWFAICALACCEVLAAPDSPNAAANVDRPIPPQLDRYGLTVLSSGRAMRASSSAVDWANSNGDARPIQPGETLVLADLKGPGVIRHIWNTISSHEYGVSRKLTFRICWDGEDNPSVLCPLGDFFGVGHGVNRDVKSEMVRVSAGGLARNCYWPMPFQRSARITVTNDGAQPVISFYYYVDWISLPSLPANTPYFHAHYRQEHPCESGHRYQVADIRGKGHYVGTLLNCRQHQRGWMGEGDDFFFVDGDKEPSVRGTGTEDYFCDAWGFRESDGPYYGITMYEGAEIQDRTSVYRWHLADPMPFQKSLRFEMEHYGWWWIPDGKGGEKITDGDRYDDWSTVAFWYQMEPHLALSPLPSGKDRLYYDWSSPIEAESLETVVDVSDGGLGKWGGGGCSGGLFLHWHADKVSQSLKIPFAVKTSGTYSLVLAMIRRPHFGIFSFEIDANGTGRHLDLYHQDLSSREFALPPVELAVGEHHLTVRNVGKNFRSTGYCFGLDALLLHVEAKE